LPFTEAQLTALTWRLPVWEWSQVPWLGWVPLVLLVVPLGGETSQMASIELETSLDVLGHEVGIVVVVWVRNVAMLHPHVQADHAGGETKVEEANADVELPSVGWLLIFVVSVLEVTVVERVNFFGGHGTPVALRLLSNGVELWVLIGPFGRLWEGNQERFVVIGIPVRVLEELLGLLLRLEITRVVNVVVACSRRVQRPSNCHSFQHLDRGFDLSVSST